MHHSYEHLATSLASLNLLCVLLLGSVFLNLWMTGTTSVNTSFITYASLKTFYDSSFQFLGVVSEEKHFDIEEEDGKCLGWSRVVSASLMFAPKCICFKFKVEDEQEGTLEWALKIKYGCLP